MRAMTKYWTAHTKKRRELVRITERCHDLVREAKIQEGMLLVSAMHITACVFVNDDEPGLHADIEAWAQRLAPGPSADGPFDGPEYLHHRSGEDNGDAHLKNLLIGHQVILPITNGKLDLGPWQQVFYYECDGRRDKRVVFKAMGE